MLQVKLICALDLMFDHTTTSTPTVCLLEIEPECYSIYFSPREEAWRLGWIRTESISHFQTFVNPSIMFERRGNTLAAWKQFVMVKENVNKKPKCQDNSS